MHATHNADTTGPRVSLGTPNVRAKAVRLGSADQEEAGEDGGVTVEVGCGLGESCIVSQHVLIFTWLAFVNLFSFFVFSPRVLFSWISMGSCTRNASCGAGFVKRLKR